MKVYTKKGDGGITQLIGGTRVPKSSLRIEAYGTIDELNSHIGLIRDSFDNVKSKEQLEEIQDRLFTIGSILAADPESSKMKLPDLKSEDVEYLEKAIDEMEKEIPEMKSFVLPGGHVVSSYAHIARCVCRRGERVIVDLDAESPVSDSLKSYVNRLSDYLFVLARFIVIENGAKEIPWVPRMD